MDFAIPAADQARVRAARVQGQALCSPEDVAERDRSRTFSRAAWRALGAEKVPGVIIPTAHGGQGLDALQAVLLLEGLARGCADQGLLLALSAHVWGCTAPLLRFATPTQKAAWLPGLADGSTLCALAMTEADSGSDAFALATRAVQDGDEYVISGEKCWITSGPVADAVLVIARTSDGPPLTSLSAFWVAGTAPGLTRGPDLPRIGLRTCPLGSLTFDAVRVPATARLGAEGAGAQVFLTAMNWERVGIMTTALGSMDRLLARAVRHARTRKLGGEPIRVHQAVSHRIAAQRANLETSRLLLYRAAAMLREGRTGPLEAALSKLHSAEAHVETALATMRILGARGLLESEGVERELRDALCGLFFSGTSDIQRNLVARLTGA